MVGIPIHTVGISIHALLAESDTAAPMAALTPCTFLSTLSLRRATAGSWAGAVAYRYFYPRSPCGERPVNAFHGDLLTKFLSTLSLRRATQGGLFQCRDTGISIHALLAESDCGCFARCRYWAYFYPRSPCGERHLGAWKSCNVCGISIHALLAESDWNNRPAIVHTWKFLSTLSLRRATEGE